MGDDGVWNGFDGIMVYQILYFLLSGCTESVLVFLRRILMSFTCFKVYIFRSNVMNICVSQLDVNLIEINGAAWAVVMLRTIPSAMSISAVNSVGSWYEEHKMPHGVVFILWCWLK